MTTIYLTGTQVPGTALRRFLPDYLDLLISRGDTVITTNKRGVDELILHHCEQHNLPLQVCEFACDSAPTGRNRHITTQAETVRVQPIISPTWQRFRHMTDRSDRVVFLHAHRPAGGCNGLTTQEAFHQVCQKRGVDGEQFIVQEQEDIATNVMELRAAPIVGAAHVYVYARQVLGLNGEQYHIAHFRLETWRSFKGVVQPGVGRLEAVIPVGGRDHATLAILHQALGEMQTSPPQRLVIHHRSSRLEKMPFACSRPYADLRRQVRDLLALSSQVVWQHEEQITLLHHIGKSVSQGQELWNHRKTVANTKGLYQ